MSVGPCPAPTAFARTLLIAKNGSPTIQPARQPAAPNRPNSTTFFHATSEFIPASAVPGPSAPRSRAASRRGLDPVGARLQPLVQPLHPHPEAQLLVVLLFGRLLVLRPE